MGGGSLDKPSGGDKMIADAIKEQQKSSEKLQKKTEKSKKKYFVMTTLVAIGCTILGVVLGKFVLP